MDSLFLNLVFGLMALVCGAAFGGGTTWLWWSEVPPSPTNGWMDPVEQELYQSMEISRRIVRGFAWSVVGGYFVVPISVMLSTDSTVYVFTYNMGIVVGGMFTQWVFKTPCVYNDTSVDYTESLTEEPGPEEGNLHAPQPA